MKADFVDTPPLAQLYGGELVTFDKKLAGSALILGIPTVSI
jgi:hypothetical protein